MANRQEVALLTVQGTAGFSPYSERTHEPVTVVQMLQYYMLG